MWQLSTSQQERCGLWLMCWSPIFQEYLGPLEQPMHSWRPRVHLSHILLFTATYNDGGGSWRRKQSLRLCNHRKCFTQIFSVMTAAPDLSARSRRNMLSIIIAIRDSKPFSDFPQADETTQGSVCGLFSSVLWNRLDDTDCIQSSLVCVRAGGPKARVVTPEGSQAPKEGSWDDCL